MKKITVRLFFWQMIIIFLANDNEVQYNRANTVANYDLFVMVIIAAFNELICRLIFFCIQSHDQIVISGIYRFAVMMYSERENEPLPIRYAC